MKLAKRIDSNYRSLKSYFLKQFQLMQEALEEESAAPIEAENADAVESQATYHGFSHLIKPDMLINTYSLLDFWIKEICDFQQQKRQLKLRYKDIKGKNDFHRYHKYLTVYADIDLTAVDVSYEQLDGLRKVRNQLIHHGSHIQSDQESQFSSIEGISVRRITASHSFIFIKDDYVWDMLEHTKKYLHKAAIV